MRHAGDGRLHLHRRGTLPIEDGRLPAVSSRSGIVFGNLFVFVVCGLRPHLFNVTCVLGGCGSGLPKVRPGSGL